MAQNSVASGGKLSSSGWPDFPIRPAGSIADVNRRNYDQGCFGPISDRWLRPFQKGSRPFLAGSGPLRAASSGTFATACVGLRYVALTFVEKVRSQFLFLRQPGANRIFSARDYWQLSPVFAVISDLSSGPLIGSGGSFFSEWLKWGFCSPSRTGENIRFRIAIEVRILSPQPGVRAFGQVSERRENGRKPSVSPI
jgi:hypothetical protein